MLKLLVFGSTGQVATELARCARADLVVSCLSRAEADLADPSACAAAVAGTDADVIINAAAYTAVDRAETDEAAATVVNGTAPGAMAEAAARRGLPFLHLSTDYVFDGTGDGPRAEDAPTAPLNAYGRSKLAGERAIAAAGGAAVVMRTAWVFSAHGSNFVKTMLRLGATRDQISVVADQHGCPTAAADIAGALVTVARAFGAGRGVPGTFHFGGTPQTTWHGFAEAIFERAGGKRPVVLPIASAAYPTPAARPRNSVLDCTRIRDAYGIAAPDWRPALDRVLADLGAIS